MDSQTKRQTGYEPAIIHKRIPFKGVLRWVFVGIDNDGLNLLDVQNDPSIPHQFLVRRQLWISDPKVIAPQTGSKIGEIWQEYVYTAYVD